MALPAGMVTFLFTDIVGSSTKWDKHRAAMETAIAAHDTILEEAIAAQNGHVIKKMGDGIMAAFADPADAVSAAATAQQALADAPWDPVIAPLSVRMGVHTGPAEPVEGDYLGPSVNRAARIESAGHGGQILLSAATYEFIADRVGEIEFRDLGEHHLRGLSRPQRIFQATTDGQPTEFPPLRTESTPSNLPAPVKSFVGRRREIEELSTAVADHRLVTVIGPGGAGKTALAIEAARHLTSSYPAGVWLVELAALTDGALIPTEMLGAIRQPAPASEDPLDALTGRLASQQALLIIDNCEHLLVDVAAVVSAVLRASPKVTILATSREALRVGGEQTWAIPTMDQPDSADRDAVASSDAGGLFVARAASAEPRFVLTDENAATVADICDRLDGLPLAIELAAARVRSMGLAEIDRHLEDRFKLLRGGSRDDVPHHQTLQESVAWSYDLLSPEQQRLYRGLAVFAGSFDRDAAEAAIVSDAVDFIEGLDDLVAQSLLIAERGDPTRYRMLETIRQFGIERLEEAGEAGVARKAHFDWLAALVREGGRELEGRNQAMWLKKFRLEIDNVRAALGWARQHDPVAGVSVVSALTRFFWNYAAEGDSTAMRDSTSFLNEGYEWATSMLDAAGDVLPSKLRGRLQLGTGGLLCIRTGRFEEALERLDEAAAIFEAEGDARNLGWATFYRGCAGVGIVPFDETLATYERSLALHTEADDKLGVILDNLVIGHLELRRDRDLGREKMAWVLETANKIGVPALMAHGRDGAAQADASLGTVTDESKQLAAEALVTFRNLRNYACVCHTLCGAACVLAAEGDLESAARAWGVSETIRDRLSMVLAPYEDRGWAIRGIIGDKFESDAWNAAKSEGATFEPDEGIDWVVGQLGFDPTALVK